MARTLTGSTSNFLSRADQTELRPSNGLSVSLWWKGTTHAAFSYILSKMLQPNDHPTYGFNFDSGGEVRFIVGYAAVNGSFVATTTTAGSGSFYDGNWHHLCGTYDEINARCYVDGVQMGSVANANLPAYAALSLYIGSFDGTQLPTTGTVAEVALYNTALTADDVTSLKYAITPMLVRPDMLLGYWQLRGAGSPEPDLIHAMDLTINGTVAVADHPRMYDRSTTQTRRWHTVSSGHTLAVGVAPETDTATAITHSKARALGVAPETDTAIALGRVKTKLLGIAPETDTAIALTHKKTRTLGIAPETDTAIAIGKAKRTTLGMAAETDTAIAIGHKRTRAVGIATETDLAIALGRVKARLLGVAAETDLAISIGHKRTRLVGVASELDIALHLGGLTTKALGQALEVDAALAVAHRKMRQLGVAAELDVAVALHLRLIKLLGPGLEVDQALQIVRTGARITTTPDGFYVRAGVGYYRRAGLGVYQRGGILAYRR